MMMKNEPPTMIEVSPNDNLWNQCYTVHTLVVIGSMEANGDHNFAPKHMAMPLGFSNYFGFMGTPRKSTYQNIKQTGEFTVSFPKPSQLVLSSLTASPRAEDYTKPILGAIPSSPARIVEGHFIKDAYLQLECRLYRIMGQFGEWEIITGEVVAAYVSKQAIRRHEENGDAAKHIMNNPLLAYLHPDRFSTIKESNRFPYPKNFNR